MSAEEAEVYSSFPFSCDQHAHALELLSDHLVEGNRALDVGSGSGYLTACMAMMVSFDLYTIYGHV